MSATQPPEPPVAGDPPERPARSRPGVLRRPLFWAVLVLVVWWVVASVGGPLAGRLQEVQTNDNAAFLPASAESTEVNTLQQRFAEAESFPVVVLFVRDAGLTPGDVTAATRFTSEVASFPLIDEKAARRTPAHGPSATT